MRSTGTGVQRATVNATAMSTTAQDRGDGGGGYNEATQTISSATSTPSSPPQSCSLDNDVDTGGSDSGHGGDSDSSSGGDGGGARAPNLASATSSRDFVGMVDKVAELSGYGASHVCFVLGVDAFLIQP